MEDMQFVWFSMEIDFSHQESPNPAREIRRRVVRTRILYTLRHFNQAKYNVQSCRS